MSWSLVPPSLIFSISSHVCPRIHALHHYQSPIPSCLLSLTTLLFLCHAQAVNQAGAGPYSEKVSFRTPATNPDQVSSLTLLDLQSSSEMGHSPSTSLLLKWEEPNSNGAEITFYIITVDDQTITVESGTSHLITGLQPDSEYR